MHGGIVKLQDFDMETGVATMLMSGACRVVLVVPCNTKT